MDYVKFFSEKTHKVYIYDFKPVFFYQYLFQDSCLGHWSYCLHVDTLLCRPSKNWKIELNQKGAAETAEIAVFSFKLVFNYKYGCLKRVYIYIFFLNNYTWIRRKIKQDDLSERNFCLRLHDGEIRWEFYCQKVWSTTFERK